MEKMLSPGELAEGLGVPIATVYQRNHNRTGPPFCRVGKHVRYRTADVDAWLEQLRSEQAAA